MEVVMSSPVHEPSRTENTGSNDKSQKNNLRMKKKKLLLKSNAENPEIKQQHHQNNPTATVDQKHELSSPEIQHHMVTHTKSMISGETSTSDANTLSERESHAKVSNGEIGSGTPATATTVSNKSKNPSSTDNQSVHETTKTQDIVAVTNNSSTTTTTPTPTPTDVVKKKKKKKKNPESVNIQSVQETTQTQEIVPVTNQSSTTTPTDVVKKKKKKKNPESVNIQSVHETTQTQNIVSVTNKSSSTPPTSDANTLSNGDSNVTNELASRSENKKKQKVSDDDANAKSDEQMERKRKKKKKQREEDVTVHEPGFVKGERIRKPTIGEILKPGYLEELEKAEERRVLSKQMSKKNKSVKIADLVNLDSPSQTEVKPRDDKIMEKKLLIFDVNGLLGDIVSPRPKDMVADKYIPQRAIFKRPFLDDFLRFCFERFHVGIWSSRTHKVLDPAVYCLLGNLKKNLLFIWDNSFCTKTKMKTLENKHKPMVFKDLRKIWDKSWWKGPFHESNTLLIDDSPYKALLNPKNTGIFPVSYCYNDMNDNSLGPNGDLRTYLEGLANSDDVKTYVDQHPFGQPAIDETHPHWSFYSRALNSQRSKLAVHVNQRRVQF